MHQLYTKQYRKNAFDVFKRLFKHLPALGGQEDGEKFNNIYDETLDYYKAAFGQTPKPHIWEPTPIRFSHEMFSFSSVNLNRLANMSIAQALNRVKHE